MYIYCSQKFKLFGISRRSILSVFKLDFDHVTAVSSLMDRLLDLSKIAYSTEIQCVRQWFEN
jgi:hypothetical protein